MSEKPLLVTIGTDSPDDLVKITDSAGNVKERMGLVRCVPYSFLDKTFIELGKYVCDPIGSDDNPSYEGAERDIAIRYLGLLAEAPGSNLAYFYSKRGGVTRKDLHIDYNSLVSSHFSQIVDQKTIQTPAQPMDCKSIDLVISKDYGGGYRL